MGTLLQVHQESGLYSAHGVYGPSKTGEYPQKEENMPTKKNSKNPLNKAAFVRGLPVATPAKEVVVQGEKQGISLTESYVYNVRGAAKKKGKGTDANKVAASQSLAGAGSDRSSASAAKHDLTVESLLLAVGAEIGLAQAVEVLRSERARVHAVLGA
jgi:uncharacterized protein YkwD